MIIDKLLSPAISRALSGYSVATTTVSPTGGEAAVMDFGVARNNGLLMRTPGNGWEFRFRGATSGGAATAGLILVTSATSALGSPVTLYTSPVYTLAQLAAGVTTFVPMPDTNAWLRYAAWQIIVGTAVFTGGTMSIQYTANKRNWRAYPAQGNR